MELDCGKFNENEKLVIKECVTDDAESATDNVQADNMVVSSQENVIDCESVKDTQQDSSAAELVDAIHTPDDNDTNYVTLTTCLDVSKESEVENGEAPVVLSDTKTIEETELPSSENDPIDSVNNCHDGRESTSKQEDEDVETIPLINDDDDDEDIDNTNDIGDDEKEEMEEEEEEVNYVEDNSSQCRDDDVEGECESQDVQEEDDDIDSEEDSTAGESYNQDDDDDDDVAVVLDSSEEDQCNVSDEDEIENENSLHSGDDAEEEYDEYDDLMDDVVVFGSSSSSKKDKSKNIDRKYTNSKIEKKKKPHVNWRMKLKKRSLRWLNANRMHHVDEPAPIPIASIQVNYDHCSSQITSTPKANPISSETISIDIDSSPEKPSSPYSQDFSTTNTEMQQVDKISDSIKKSSEDLKQSSQHHGKTKHDEHNKENVGNNDKESSQKLKESTELVKEEQNSDRAVEISQHVDEVMEISDENCEFTQMSSETNVTVIENKEMNNAEDVPTTKDSISCDTNSQILVSKTEENYKEPVAISLKQSFKTEIKETDTVKDVKIENDINSETTQENDDSQSATIKDPLDQSNPPIDNQTPTENVEKQTSETAKRSRSVSFEETSDDVHPTKKLRAQLETQFPTHDQILTEYIEKTSNTSVDEIQKHLNQLIIEIQTLTDMIKTKEIEWNNMLHLKKVKEEICYRLSRKKQIMEIMTTKVGEVGSSGGGGGDVSILASCVETLNSLAASNKLPSSTLTTKFTNSTPNNSTAGNLNSSVLNNLSSVSAIPNNLQNSNNSTIPNMAGNSIVQSILQNRANMKSSDLAKEKANTQRLHRILVSRNILPKPSSVPAGSTKHIASTSTPIASAASGMVTIPVSFANTGPINLANSIAGGGTNGQQPILNNYLTATATVQQQLGEMLNGHHNPNQNITNGNQTLMVGRQGTFKDVKSIIADYRQKHPEAVPRRGRRMKSLGNMTQAEANSILGNVLKSEGKLGSSDLGHLLSKFEGNSRPSSNDSSHSMTNVTGTNSTNANVSFKDVLACYAKISGTNNERLGNIISGKGVSTSTNNSTQTAPPPYPEVTLHPVSTTQSNADQTGSLLHGILTKYTRPNPPINPAADIITQTTYSANYNSSFSPTLARLLTAPERITSAHSSGATTQGMSYQSGLAAQVAAAAASLNLSKVVGGHNSEITITPVVSTTQQFHQSLQQQIQNQQIKEALARDRLKYENFLTIKDDEADDSIDRLVIDEGGDSSVGGDDQHRIAPHAIGQEFHENEVPICQGCKKQEAQFVCAGCGNQWYCSRECQVAAWDEHSEICTG